MIKEIRENYVPLAFNEDNGKYKENGVEYAMFRKLVVPHYHANGRLMLAPDGRVLERGMESWDKLPEKERRPEIEPFTDEDHPLCAHHPPQGGAVVRTYVRAFDVTSDGRLAIRSEFDASQHIDGRGPHSTPLWITPDEVKALAALDAKPGDTAAFPPSLKRRLVHYYFVSSPY